MVACTFNPVLRRQNQEDLYDFEATLVYKASFRTTRGKLRNLVLKLKTKIFLSFRLVVNDIIVSTPFSEAHTGGHR